MKLITTDMTIYQQFAMKRQLDDAVAKWVASRYAGAGTHWPLIYSEANIKMLEEECGITCKIIKNGSPNQLVEYAMVDEKKFMWFKLKYL